jgi:hypothetical protein
VIKGLRAEWEACSHTVSLNHHPTAIACWEDLIAVGFQSGDTITLDAIAGIRVSVFPGHTDQVGSLAFHRMEHSSCPQVTTKPSNSGIPGPVGLSRPSTVTLAGFAPFPSCRTAPRSLQDLTTRLFAFGTFGQGVPLCHEPRIQ